MKVTLSFEELSSLLDYAGIVFSDKSVEEKMKNVIFSVDKESARFIAYNVYIFCRTTFEQAEIDIEDAPLWLFTVKFSDIRKIVSSYSNLARTKVTNISFETEGVRIKVTVNEDPKDGESERFAKSSTFTLETAAVIAKVAEEIKMPFPEEVDSVTAGDLLLYLDTLSPILSNDKASAIGSKLNFAEDYVFVINGSMSAFMVNKLPDSFKDLAISYSSASFCKRLVEHGETVCVAKTKMHLCLQEGNTEAFIRIQKLSANYKAYTSKLSKEKGIQVDRLYLKDVLRRLGSTDAKGTAEVRQDDSGEGYCLNLSSPGFFQEVPLNNVKDAVGLKFDMSIPVLEKTILGRDDIFTSDLYIYFTETARGYIIFLSDKTGSWLANTQVTRV